MAAHGPAGEGDTLMDVLERLESNVRSYSRAFPVVFDRAEGAYLYDEAGRRYIDFFAGAGVMNYGHNNPRINRAWVEHISRNGILHSLDKFTTARRRFLEDLESIILAPRKLEYKVQFCGPTGANAVEAALKVARQAKQRRGIIAFTRGYHGMSLGALAATGNSYYKSEFFPGDLDVVFMPYDRYLGPKTNTAGILRRFLTDKSSGVRPPAGVILETIQAEGGVNVASAEWLREIEQICREFDIVLIIDEIQVGNGRSGDFFSFERAGLRPDLVVLSKAIGAGIPIALLLIRPDLDVWRPAQHTGTFRGNNLAFVGGAVALEEYWRTDAFSRSVKEKAGWLKTRLDALHARWPDFIREVRGCGLIQGLVIPEPGLAVKVSRAAFTRGLVIELAGPDDEVLKFLPPLVIEQETLKAGVDLIEETVAEVAKNR
jgi:diaminobutyrate-2-oxoglutarate transaminase